MFYKKTLQWISEENRSQIDRVSGSRLHHCTAAALRRKGCSVLLYCQKSQNRNSATDVNPLESNTGREITSMMS